MNNVADKLYNILGTKFDNTDIKTLDSKGKETTDMEEIEMFSFDFLVNSRNYGPVVILLSANDNLEVYYGDNTSKSLDSDAKKKWENLIEHLSTFARTNRLGFSLKHTSDLKYDLSNITDITESYRNIFEGYYGTTKTSYSPQGKAKIIIKHSKAIGEEDKRFRNISQIFIENADGERFKLPFKKLTGARAMARHVTEGGNPYDLFGVHISEMVNDINTLGGFVRRSKMYEGNDDAMAMVETGRTHYNDMRKNLKRIAGVRGYQTYKESWEPSAITEQETDTTTIRNMFMDNKVNQRTEDALPLLARLQQMAEAKSKIDWPEEVKGGHPDEDDWGDDDLDNDPHPFNTPPEISFKDHPEYDDWERELGEASDDEPSMKVVQTPSGPKWVPVDDAPKRKPGKRKNYSDQDIDLDEGQMADVNEKTTYLKIKDWDATALKGYARRIGMAQEVFGARNMDADSLIDEIMGFLYDDDWEMKLIKAGAFDVPEQAEPEKDNSMKEITEFENWAEEIVEGTWAIPDTPKTLRQLKAFMATEQPLGIDAMNATDALSDVLGADDLFDELEAAASKNPDADARPIVKDYIETMYKDLDGFDETDHRMIKTMYKAIGGGELAETNFSQDIDADDETQLNASVNKDLDTYIKKEDEDTNMKPYSEYVQEAEAEDEIVETEVVDEEVIEEDDDKEWKKPWEKDEVSTSADADEKDDEDDDEDKEKLEEAGTPIVTMDDGNDLGDLMQRTNFLLNK